MPRQVRSRQSNLAREAYCFLEQCRRSFHSYPFDDDTAKGMAKEYDGSLFRALKLSVISGKCIRGR